MSVTNHNTFSDVIPLWQQCLASSGLIVNCLTRKDALRLAQRLNGYRSAFRKHQSELSLVPGIAPQIEHDFYKVSIDLCSVRLEKRILANVASITDLAGNPVSPIPETDDGLL